MTDKTKIERRSLIAASGAALSLSLLPKYAVAQTAGTTASAASGHFEGVEVKVGNNTIFIRRYGNGAPVLMVHGFPRTSLMWRYVAPQLSSNHTVICVDLRGYGRSGVPDSAEDHFPYTKRAMGNELVSLMDKLGFAKFDLVGHDRGGRVSYRLTLDHPEKVQRLAVFDVIPISEAWGLADTKFAMTYWPWSLLSQKAPLPEKYLLGAPDAVFDNPFGGGSFGPEVKAEYLETYRDPTRVHAICEEYRAAAGLDIEHDKTDQKIRRITCPDAASVGSRRTTRHFLRTGGWRVGDLAKVGRQRARAGHQGRSLFPEENPTETTELLRKFLLA